MNPVILIPTYIAGSRNAKSPDILETYDHMTSLSRQGELPRCLSSMREHHIDVPIAIFVVSESGFEEQAQAKVIDIARHYSDLNITVIATGVEKSMHARMKQMSISGFIEGIALAGYGPIHNLAMIYALCMGYSEAIFVDDDEIITDDDFIEKACYGLGMLSENDVPILVKSGYFLNKKGDYHAKVSNKWYDKYWNEHKIGFNSWIDSAMSGSRLSISNTVCGGCLAIHREAMKRVSFDPWITRGEDLDYLLNVRMYGSEIWFDNEWCLIHRPPINKDEVSRFSQDMHRWYFENRKLEYLSSQIDLLQVIPQNLEPYPGRMLSKEADKIISKTAFRRFIGCSKDRKAYFKVLTKERKAAKEYAMGACSNYFPFQHQWPEVVAILAQDIALKGIFESACVSSGQGFEDNALADNMEHGGVISGAQDGTTGGVDVGVDVGAQDSVAVSAKGRAQDGVQASAQDGAQASAQGVTDQAAQDELRDADASGDGSFAGNSDSKDSLTQTQEIPAVANEEIQKELKDFELDPTVLGLDDLNV